MNEPRLIGADLESLPSRIEQCATHGEFKSRHIFGRIFSKCPECNRIESAKEAEKKAEQERIDHGRRWHAQLGEAAIPERFTSRTLENYIPRSKEQKRALEICENFANGFLDNTGKSLIFCGLPGTGKTHLSIGICQRIMRDHKCTALFTTAMKMLRRIKGSWDRNSEESETEAIRIFVKPDLLVLDEIGIQFGSETEKNLLFDVLNERYEQQKPVILISNLTLDEIKKYLGERVYDRLKEDGAESIPFKWESHRGRTAA